MAARDELLAIPDDLLRSGKVSEATLVFMDFTTGARRWWTGWGELDANGDRWSGTGDLIAISSVATSYEASATPMEFTLSALPEWIDLARDNLTAFKGRAVQVFSQLFVTQQAVSSDAEIWEPGVTTEPWQPVGPKMALFSGAMETLAVRFRGLDTGEIVLGCEGVFVKRNAPPRGLWTDRDQQARRPGDKGLELVARYENYETRWF